MSQTSQNEERKVVEGTQDFLEKYIEEGQQLLAYTSRLSMESKLANPKGLCIKCWSRLTYNQKSLHNPEHIDFIKKPSQYSDLESFVQLAEENARSEYFGSKKYFERLKEKPLACHQNTKKMKLTKDFANKPTEEKITIQLPSKNAISPNQDEGRKAKVLNPKPTQVN